MSRYPFTPELLDALPEELAELFRALELVLLDEICSRLKVADELNEVTVQDIKALRAHGIDLKKIKKAIQKATGISEQKLNKLLDDVVERNQQYYTNVIDLAHITQPESMISAVSGLIPMPSITGTYATVPTAALRSCDSLALTSQLLSAKTVSINSCSCLLQA